MIHTMLNNRKGNSLPFREYMGCIWIDDNVFVGANTTILANVHISSNVIICVCSLVNKNLESGYVYVGVPTKKICTLEDFVAKREHYADYPESMKSNGDLDDEQLTECPWKKLCESRV